ncbi:hypothetical protein E2C01_025707 [Portunus trituberculatus]|uniref:Uncharacterized protein n=1 Tax=Portunus trituberculatus TaxID=210409 RepID=A0A5B7EGU6_PORTR|nr:hypothetical protein [Portunus trituberculatus]
MMGMTEMLVPRIRDSDVFMLTKCRMCSIERVTLHVQHYGGKAWAMYGSIVGGEGAVHPEACEEHLLPPCGTIGGGPLAQDGFDGVEVEVVPVTLPQEFC